jgi:hypothetical protein
LQGHLSRLIATSASLLWISTAAAEPTEVHLVWQRPVGSLCPTAATLEADVEQALGRHVFSSSSEAAVVVRGVAEDLASEARARIEARTADGVLLGTRELVAPAGQCASLRGAIALVLTLFVERDEASDDGLADVRVGLGAALAVLSTPLPRATLAGGPSLSLELGRALRIRADASYWLPVSIQTSRGVGARMEAVSVALRGCVRVWGEPKGWALSACPGVELGALIATPQRLAGPTRQARLLAHGFLELRAEAPLGTAAALEVAAGPLLSLSRPQFSYVRRDDATMDVYRPQLGGAFLQVSLIILDI